MSISWYNIKKWSRMLTGKSLLHVQQNIGTCFSATEIKGYYNDLTRKVTQDKVLLDTLQLPVNYTETGKTVYFPVQIFQYGLGAYDLYLQTKEQRFLERFNLCVSWAKEHQLNNGSWDNFSFLYPQAPYGAMCQGEGASLLLRAYVRTQNVAYLQAAKQAIDFMLLPLEKGGTTLYKNEDVILQEYTHLPTVLNGFIFAWFGLADISLVDRSYLDVKERALQTLMQLLPQFDNGYWSLYSLDKKMASPFYHNLHVAQLQALYRLTGQEIFNAYARRWARYQKNQLYKGRAFVKKAWQKIREK